MALFINVQMVPVRCIFRSHGLKIDFRYENFISLEIDVSLKDIEI